jgi:CBS domain-containing protein
METVKDVLSEKGKQIWAVKPETTVADALKLMAEKNIGAVLVVDEKEKMRGIFSERDFARKSVAGKGSGGCPTDGLVRDFMSSEVVYVKEEQSIDNCMALMTEKRLRHLPVLHEGDIVGLISIGDVVKAVISEKDFIIDQMEHYIWDNA